MKFNIFKITLLAGLLCFSSCSDDYLETYPSQLLSQDDINNSAETRPLILIGYLNGLYGTMYDPGSGGTSSHDDFGQKGWDIYMDMLSQDMVLGGTTYGHYKGLSDFSATENYTDIVNYKPWRYYYRIIYSANALIQKYNVEEVGYPKDVEEKAKLAQALSIRAYSYYNLALLYIKDVHDMQKPTLPIYTKAGTTANPLSTTGEVFKLMIDDLEASVKLFNGYQRDDKFRINQSVAQSILAYVYALKGDDMKAAENAKAVVDRGEFPLTSKEDLVYDGTTGTGGGFNDVSVSSWMWGQDLTTDIGLNLVSWWGQMDPFTYSYAWAGDRKIIDAGLRKSIPAGDIRGNQFNSTGMAIGKFYAPGRQAGGQRTVTTDYIYMRVDEMYFLYAESAAKSGNVTAARQTMKELMKVRIPEAADFDTYMAKLDALSGDDLVDEIVTQARIEFWGEGKSYAMMKRNNQTRTRGDNHLVFIGESFPSTDSRLSLEIPQSEIQNNPNLNK